MKRSFGFVAVILISIFVLCAAAYGRDPIKWSAPMNEYPSSWYPSAPPPSYYNSYGNQYPYAGYGYGAYGGYYGGQQYQGDYQQQQRGFSGNPYNYNYYYGQ
jgi:hypothetical protein